MKAFYGSEISENMTKTPEGFLICFNVPIARTGWYDYLPQEICREGQGMVKVYRSPREVFSKQAIASFEGKIVTNGHPPDLLTPQNSELYTKGAVQNVRQSTFEKDLLLADLIIYNDVLIKEIEQGKRDVSCGYEFNCVDNGDGTYSQVQICGNHVAVVENGRAGDRVAIKDSKIKEMEGEKKKMSKVKIPKKQRGPITNLFAAIGVKHFATDAEPEEIANALDALAEERQEENDEDPKELQKATETPEQSKDEEPNSELSALTQEVAKLREIVIQLVNPKEKSPEEAIDAMIGELSEGENSTGDEENSVTVPVGEMDENIPKGVVQDPSEKPSNPIQSSDSAAMIRALKAMKPVIAAIKDPAARQTACDSLMAEFKKAKKTVTKSNGNGYANILNVQQTNANNLAAQDSANKQQKVELIGDNYKKLNPHYNKKGMN